MARRPPAESSLALTAKLQLVQLGLDPPTATLLRQKLAPLQVALQEALCDDLSSSTLRRSGAIQLVAFFYRLGQADVARSTFLNARTEILRRRARTIKFEGDISLYIGELAVVSFMGVKNTTDWFTAAFRENGMASCASPLNLPSTK